MRAGAEGRTVCIILSDMPKGVVGVRIQPIFHRYGCIVLQINCPPSGLKSACAVYAALKVQRSVLN